MHISSSKSKQRSSNSTPKYLPTSTENLLAHEFVCFQDSIIILSSQKKKKVEAEMSIKQ